MTMIRIPANPTRANSRKKGTALYPCIICGKDVKRPINMVRVFWGTHIVSNEEAAELNESGDTGLHPVGSECLRKHPEINSYIVS